MCASSFFDLCLEMHRHALTDSQWKTIKKLLPTGRGRPPRRTNRNFINAVVWTAKTGAPWRDLPGRFGSWKTVYNRFRNWSIREVWLDIFGALRLTDDEVGGILDGSIVRAHQDAAGGIGGPKKMVSVVLVEASLQRSTSP